MSRSRAWLLLLVVLTSSSALARAQSGAPEASTAAVEELARGLFRKGLELSSQGRWSEAEAAFRASQATVSRASTAYNLTLALLHLGRGREALDRLAELSTQYGPDAHPYRDQLQALRAHALQLVARLDLSLAPSYAALEVDGQPLTGGGASRDVILDPGEHRLRGSAEGFEPIVLTLRVAAGEQRSEHMALTPLAPAPSSEPPVEPVIAEPTAHAQPLVPAPALPHEPSSAAPPWPSIGLLAVGGGLVATGAVFGVLALDENASFDKLCPDRTRCRPEDRNRLRAIDHRIADYALASDALLVGGIVVATAGLVWWWLAPTESEPRLTAVVAPSLIGVSVRQCF